MKKELFDAEVKFQKQKKMAVKKSNLSIQKARYSLSLQEQKILCYLVANIQDDDTHMTQKVFNIKEFYDFMEINHKDYENVRKALKKLRDTSWWLPIDDKGTESAMSFLSTVQANKGTGKAYIKFHEDMFPHLVQLQDKFTQYKFFYVMTMRSQYAIRLYELLKSIDGLAPYYFDLDDLKSKFMCENYVNFYDFRRWVLDKAIKEINEKTDIVVSYETLKDGNKVSGIEFDVEYKDKRKLLEAERSIRAELEPDNPMYQKAKK